MAMRTNSQIVDAVATTVLDVVGDAPSQALAVVYQAMSHATGLSMENAQQCQGNMQQVALTALSVICREMIAVQPSAAPPAAEVKPAVAIP